MEEHWAKQDIPAGKSFMSISCAHSSFSRLWINLKFQLRWCAAPQWCRERSAEKERKRSNTGRWTYLSSIPFINITCYKKNKIFSVNELSNNIASVDYRWYGTLIPRVVAVGLKTSNTVDLAFPFHSQGQRLSSHWSCSTDFTTICPCISIVTVT